MVNGGTSVVIGACLSSGVVVSDQSSIRVIASEPGDPPVPHHKPSVRGIDVHAAASLHIPVQALPNKAPPHYSRGGSELTHPKLLGTGVRGKDTNVVPCS
jgi:hypothetical protein